MGRIETRNKEINRCLRQYEKVQYKMFITKRIRALSLTGEALGLN